MKRSLIAIVCGGIIGVALVDLILVVEKARVEKQICTALLKPGLVKECKP